MSDSLTLAMLLGRLDCLTQEERDAIQAAIRNMPREQLVGEGMNFTVTEEEMQIIKEWFAKVQKRLIASGKAKGGDNFGEGPERVYYGAIGGGLTYLFTPTSLGTVLEVQESRSGEKLNVTEANGWKDFG